MLKNLSYRKLFLIDGIGAVITALLLSLVLAQFEPYFGMPAKILYILAGLAVVFAFYSFSCYWLLNNNYSVFLKGIATANILYCLLTIALMIYFHNSLTWLGIAYFVGEIILVLSLAQVEIKTSRNS